MTIKRKELLALPVRAWPDESTYDSLYLVPSGRKHESGYMCVAIVGIRDHKPVEIAAFPDDIEWKMPQDTSYWGDMRMDCEYPSGILHPWSHRYAFKVGRALSSTTITLVKRQK